MITENSHRSRSGVARIWRATAYSLAGLKSAWQTEAAFRQELLLAVILIPIAVWIPGTLTQRALLIACVLVVLLVELLNSAIESTVDRVSLDDHELAKRAKDVGSAAVLIALLNLLVVWALVLADVFNLMGFS